MKRGPKPLPVERRKHARVTVAVTEDVSALLYIYAQRKRATMSEAIGQLLERLAERERQINPVYATSPFDKSA